MNELEGYLNGNWQSVGSITVPIYDSGFVLGTSVTEQLRTFAGKIFRLEEHLDRLFRSLAIVEIDSGISRSTFRSLAEEAISRNFSKVPEGSDLGLGIFVTPGVYATLAGNQENRPTVCLYTYHLPFAQWAHKYRQGESVIISDIQQISPRSWPPELKCRSRMHYYLADLQARKVEPGARAILLDGDGFVNEATTANIVIYRQQEGLVSPPKEKILPGVSLYSLEVLAKDLDIPFVFRDITPEELLTADEMLLCSTSVCLLPVVRCQGKAVGGGASGAMCSKLLDHWSKQVGLDIVAQAIECAKTRLAD